MAKAVSVSSPKQKRDIAGMIPYFIFGLAFILFFNSVFNGYNLDDELVTKNHRLTSKGISAIPEIFKSPYYQDNMGYSYEYRPIVLVSFAIEHEIFGDNSHISHFFNVLLYAFCCLLLFQVFRKLFAQYNIWMPAIICALFIVHPSHTEVVDNIKNRDEILALIFALLSMRFTLLALKTGKWWIWTLIPIFFILALLSKITIISMALIIPCAVVFFTSVSWRQLVYIALSLSLPVYFLTDQFNVLGKIGLIALLVSIPLLLYLITISRTFSLPKIFRTEIKWGSNVAEYQTQKTDDSPFFRFAFPKDIWLFIPGWLLLLLSVGIFFLGGYSVWVSAILVFMMISFGIFIIGSPQWKFWFRVIFYVLCGFVYYHNVSNEVWPPLIALFVSYELFYGEDYFRIIPLIGIVVLAVAEIYFNKGADPILLTLFMLGLRWCKAYILSVILIAVGLIGFIIDIIIPLLTHHLAAIKYTSIPFVLIPFFVFRYFKPYQKYYAAALHILSIIFISWFFMVRLSPDISTGPRTSAIILRQVESSIESVKHLPNTSIIPAHQNRELLAIETPVMPSDPISIRIGTALDIMLQYFTKTIFPYPLSFYYGYSTFRPVALTSPMSILSACLYLLITGIFLYNINRNRLLSLGLLIFIISVGVFANFYLPIPGMFADRFMFIPSLGWSIVLCGLLYRVFKIDPKNSAPPFPILPKAFIYSLSLIVIVYGGLSFYRNFEWKDKLTLYSHDIKSVPNSAQAHNLLALVYMSRSFELTDTVAAVEMRKEAINHFRAAIDIYPGFFNYNYDLGRVYSLFNKNDSALYFYQKAYDLNPQGALTELIMNLGILYQEKGNIDTAVRYYREYISVNPSDIEGYNKLSYLYYLRANYQEAIDVFESGQGKLPPSSSLYFSIAQNFIAMKRMDSAFYYLNKAKEMSPNDPTINQTIMGLQKGQVKPVTSER